jgi:signal transduction histidine kinase
LLINAVKFTGEGGKIKISAKVDSKSRIFISVQDTGVGIPEQELSQVIEPFFKSGRSDTATSEGSGLGLSVAREFMTLHTGDLTVESSVGTGTLVTCTFPAWRTFERDMNAIASG